MGARDYVLDVEEDFSPVAVLDIDHLGSSAFFIDKRKSVGFENVRMKMAYTKHSAVPRRGLCVE
jgi:hypothetical protein